MSTLEISRCYEFFRSSLVTVNSSISNRLRRVNGREVSEVHRGRRAAKALKPWRGESGTFLVSPTSPFAGYRLCLNQTAFPVNPAVNQARAVGLRGGSLTQEVGTVKLETGISRTSH